MLYCYKMFYCITIFIFSERIRQNYEIYKTNTVDNCTFDHKFV